jgi:ferredoxin-NADP reductase
MVTTIAVIPGPSSGTRVTEAFAGMSAPQPVAPISGTTAPTGIWTTGKVVEVSHPTPNSVIIRLDVANRVNHLPGQHYVVRLRADDGYVAQRSYSVASPPADPLVELWIERIFEGEVSGYLAEVVEPGDELEVRGPIGGWFVWDGASPAVGVAGGSGVVPLISMLRHAEVLGRPELLQLAVSGRRLADLPYPDELAAAGVFIALSRTDQPDRPAGRLTAAELRPLITGADTTYVCGSAGFAEFASSLLVELGCPAAGIRVVRFWPSG